MNTNDLKEEMLSQAILILRSVSWLETQINKKILEFDEAIVHNNNDIADEIHNQILNLLLKLNREVINMDEFMIKYRQLIKNEKETLLSTSSKKK